MNNVFYFNSINQIGGVESFFYYLSKLYKNIVVLYEKADPLQVQRLAKNVEVRKWNGETIKCKNFFCNYGFYIRDYVEAENYYFIVHCDYKRNKLSSPFIYEGFHYIGVSKLASNSFTELTGIPCETIYNPIALDIPQVKKKTDKLHLVSATRLSGEKGGWRMDKLVEILDKAKVNYDWTIYSNKSKKITINSPNVILKEPKLDLSKEMAEASYVVQLSDHEAFGLSVAESLVLGTPVIITDIPAFHEIGCNETNAIFLDLNMTNIDVDKIVNSKWNFKYTPPKSNWGKYLDNNSNYNPKDLVDVKVLKRKLFLIDEKKETKRDDIVKLTKERASYLEAKGYVEWLY